MLIDRPLVFVTVGTDIHPFHRLVDWIDSWVATKPPGRVRCLLQTGTSRAPRRASHRDHLPLTELEAMMREATAVVCHAGPGTVMQARSLGKVPIVVPRLADLNEHVDDHQPLFARWMAAHGDVELAEEEDRLHQLLDAVISGERSLRLPARHSDTNPAVRRFEYLMEELLPPGVATRQPDGPAQDSRRSDDSSGSVAAGRVSPFPSTRPLPSH